MVARRALQGAALAVGAPAGWLVLEALGGLTPCDAIERAPGLHVYLLLGTILAFSSFGFLLGRVEQRLQDSNDRMRLLSITDPLTGLRNRRYFDARLEEACAEAVRYRRPLALVMIDLDRFKVVNDCFGHPTGDRVLQAVGAEVSAAARGADSAARVGGEELALLLPGSSLEEARVLAGRLLDAIRAISIPLPVGEPVTISASAGIAALDLVSGGPEDLFASADEALYRAKDQGRDRVSA